jgi:endonuclease YncB( thermonuclease family)
MPKAQDDKPTIHFSSRELTASLISNHTMYQCMIASMNRIAAWVLALAFPLLLTQAWADMLEGHVIHVTDGDTITVLKGKEQIRVRIGGIDAPERRQAFSKQSTDHLSGMVRRQIVTVEWYKKDRYGRLVGSVFLKGRDIGLEQVRAGLAWHFKRYANEQTSEAQQVYTLAENAARERHLGLWTDPRPVPPWEWREQQRTEAAERVAR